MNTKGSAEAQSIATEFRWIVVRKQSEQTPVFLKQIRANQVISYLTIQNIYLYQLENPPALPENVISLPLQGRFQWEGPSRLFQAEF